MKAKVYDPTMLGLQVSKMIDDEAIVYCPYHHDSRPSASYNVVKGWFYCFGCQTSKKVNELAEDLGGVMVPISVTQLVERGLEGEEIDQWIRLLGNRLAIDNEYLQSRGVENWQVTEHSIKENRDGIIFTIRDKMGHEVGAQVRHYERQPKYMFYGKRQPVWPWRNLFMPGKFFVVEGAFGVLRAESFLVNAVSTMGASSAATAAKYLKAANGDPYSVMDRDFAGYLAAGKLCLHGIPAIIWPRPWNDAPDEMTELEWESISGDSEEFATLDVNKIIEASPDPFRMEKALKRYWRKMK